MQFPVDVGDDTGPLQSGYNRFEAKNSYARRRAPAFAAAATTRSEMA